jgi:hypothetical protein
VAKTKTADHLMIGGQFGVILYQPSQGFIPYAGNGKQTEKFFIPNSSSPVGDTERQYLFKNFCKCSCRNKNYKAICF